MSDAGSVTAEFVVVVPAVVLLLALCLSAMQLSGRQLRLQDAAAGAARSAARGDGAASAAGLVERLAPGAALEVTASGDLMCVRLDADGGLAGGLFAAVPLAARSCAPRGGR